MMAQISLEFMTYLAVSAASLVVSLSLVLPYLSGMGESATSMELSDFVAGINSAMAYSSSSFMAMIPKGLCNSTIGGGTIANRYGSFVVNGDVVLGARLCGREGTLSMVYVERNPNGSFTVT